MTGRETRYWPSWSTPIPARAKAGVDAVGARIGAHLARHGIPVATLPVAAHGDVLRAQVAGSGGSNRPAVLMDHCDTVFPAGEAGRRPFRDLAV